MSSINAASSPTASRDFVLSTQARSRLTSAGSITSTTDHDANISRQTSAGVAQEFDVSANVPATVTATAGFTSLDPTIATVNATTGVVTRVSSGTARIQGFVAGFGTRQISGSVSTSSTTFDTFTTWRAATLEKACADGIDTLLAGKTAGATTQNLFSTEDDTTPNYVRNASIWATGVDLTSIAASINGTDRTHGGTLITARHIVLAAHLGLQAGHTLRFVSATGVVTNRTVLSVATITGTDILIARLDSDVPAGIAVAKVLPATWRTKAPSLAYGLPIAHVNQFKKLNVLDWFNCALGNEAYVRAPTDSKRLEFYAGVINGDSGSPAGLIIGTEFVLLGCWHTQTTFPMLADNITAINAAITTLGGGGSLTTFDISGYTAF